MLFSIIKLFKHEIINQLGNFAFHRLLLFSINWKNETNRYYCCLKEFLLTSIKVLFILDLFLFYDTDHKVQLMLSLTTLQLGSNKILLLSN